MTIRQNKTNTNFISDFRLKLTNSSLHFDLVKLFKLPKIKKIKLAKNSFRISDISFLNYFLNWYNEKLIFILVNY